jgi:hypothetical protein
MTGRDGAPDEAATPVIRRTRIARELWWGGLAVAFAVFIGMGRLSTYRGRKGREPSDVWDVWGRLAGDLPGGDSALLRIGYALALVAFVGGSLVALWLALAADGSDETTGQQPSIVRD